MIKYIDLIRAGKKTVEGRIYERMFKSLHPGDQVEFFNFNVATRVRCRIDAINVYAGFREMLEREGIENVLPGVASVEDGVATYRNIKGYARKESSGVIAIRISVMH